MWSMPKTAAEFAAAALCVATVAAFIHLYLFS
ncbi:Uncharacterised protein [Serratia rubidaea]|uniref:Uncharacterized protein n=1 Tax=Serratia rubidaea TaxID=61652 RepID=A0A3S4WP75_SERRU|nr:hypothetical protein D781_1108 [Serratia sp. FGI94]CAI0916338.1 Uncharacterised protein [Serratia rubidaea]CAI1769579.1 Uncharacterised protein [Serratia rubidaea]VEA72283.1 Uncharacterised protein [Serratia rubidaea]VEI61370.1 Uncharacterised protein [Serratia rubidaea]